MIRDAAGLIEAGLAPPEMRTELEATGKRYAVAITPTMRALIETPGDPIGRQFIPDPDELRRLSYESADPIGDDLHSPLPGLVHRHPDRVLLKPVLVCPVYCRFCFRREHVGPGGGALTPAQLDAAIAYIQSQPAIREVILTGGDPLMLSPRKLADLLDRLSHLELLRVHTRVPVADPERITPEVAEILGRHPTWVVLHANHCNEFSPDAMAALRRLRQAGVPLLGQSVLLRGVNDSAEALENLFRAMLRTGVKPYYLHQLDPAPGTSRFHVPVEEGRALLADLRGRMTGLAWPTYVVDIEGGHGKVPIGPDYLESGGVRDLAGALHELAGPGRPV